MRLLVLAVALVGCVGAEKPVPEFGAGACDPSKSTALVGRVADATVVAEAKRLTRSKGARVVAPGAMVTMDYRTDRVNLHVDPQGKVVMIRCG